MDMGIYRSEEFLSQLMRHEGAVRDKNGMHVAYVCPAGALTAMYMPCITFSKWAVSTIV